MEMTPEELRSFLDRFCKPPEQLTVISGLPEAPDVLSIPQICMRHGVTVMDVSNAIFNGKLKVKRIQYGLYYLVDIESVRAWNQEREERGVFGAKWKNGEYIRVLSSDAKD